MHYAIFSPSCYPLCLRVLSATPSPGPAFPAKLFTSSYPIYTSNLIPLLLTLLPILQVCSIFLPPPAHSLTIVLTTESSAPFGNCTLQIAGEKRADDPVFIQEHPGAKYEIVPPTAQMCIKHQCPEISKNSVVFLLKFRQTQSSSLTNHRTPLRGI